MGGFRFYLFDDYLNLGASFNLNLVSFVGWEDLYNSECFVHPRVIIKLLLISLKFGMVI